VEHLEGDDPTQRALDRPVDGAGSAAGDELHVIKVFARNVARDVERCHASPPQPGGT
jgi:hypothetical protein